MAGGSPQIVLSCLRPQGRRSFTCAHELGHHIFGHGQQFDEMKSDRAARRVVSPVEFVADCFAAYFLMPKVAIENGMARRGIRYETLQPAQVYALASWLGVGYKTLISHLRFGLKRITPTQAEALNEWSPASLRPIISGRHLTGHLHLVDFNWVGRALDCEVGDFLMIPAECTREGRALGPVETAGPRKLLRIQEPGIARLSCDSQNWAMFVRASKQRYVGRSRYRFEETVDADDDSPFDI